MPEDSEAFDDFLGEEVVDSERSAIGTFACYWEHDAGKPVLLGIDVDGRPGTHVMPAKDARLDSNKSYVVLPFSKEKIQRAPCLECGSDLDAKFEKKVFAYYGAAAIDYDATHAIKRELRKKAFGNPSPK